MFSFFKSKPTVSLIRLNGVIGNVGRFSQGMSYSSQTDIIKKAFALKNIKAVVISINSPGGSPVQSNLLYDLIRSQAEEKKVKVITYAEDVAASGGYMLMCAGDEIYANANSIVGSIGVIYSAFGFQDLIKKIGVERRVHTAGESKSILDPFLEEKKEDVEKLKSLQKDLHEEFIKLHIKFGGVAMRALSDGSFYLTYQDKDKLASKITKPCYLGGFILGYSRKIMLDYLQKSNPYFNSDQFDQQIANAPYYTDTDSIQIHKRNLNGLSLNNEIGGISDDLGENCKILYGGWIAPKLYFLEYAEKTNDSEEVKYHLRGKGIPKDQLTIEMFESMMTGKSINIEMQRNFKRIHVNRNSKQKDIDNFSILQLDALGKQINTVPWRGRHFIGNSSVPLHHNSIN